MAADNYSWLIRPIHKNTFKKLKLDWQTPAILDTLKMSFDGSIVAVLTSAVTKYLEDPQITSIRMGFSKLENMVKIETEDDFYKYLAYHVEIAEE